MSSPSNPSVKPTLSVIAPELMSELNAALLEEGQDAAARQLEDLLPGQVTIDNTVCVGYIYVQSPRSERRSVTQSH